MNTLHVMVKGRELLVTAETAKSSEKTTKLLKYASAMAAEAGLANLVAAAKQQRAAVSITLLH